MITPSRQHVHNGQADWKGFVRLAVLACVAALPAGVLGQTNSVGVASNSAAIQSPGAIQVATNDAAGSPAQMEAIRQECIKGRRSICGKILKVQPDGLVVESGYTDLLRPPLNQSWLVPGTAMANRTPGLMEGNEPDCVAVGTVFLSNLPKLRGKKPNQYDYVVIEGYPAGHYTYSSAVGIKHTVRRFCAILPVAVQLNARAAAEHAARP